MNTKDIAAMYGGKLQNDGLSVWALFPDTASASNAHPELQRVCTNLVELEGRVCTFHYYSCSCEKCKDHRSKQE